MNCGSCGKALEPWDAERGCTPAGHHGSARHLGDPLTVAQICELPDHAEIVITWDGGNGPHGYRVLVASDGTRCVETCYADPICRRGGPIPFNRVTVGWGGETR